MDLGTVGLARGATEDRFILGVDEHLAAVDPTVTGDDAIPGKLLVLHAEVVALVLSELVQFDKTAVIEDVVDPFARRELAVLADFLEPDFATAQCCLAL